MMAADTHRLISPEPLHLVVAADERKRGMMPEAAHVVMGLLDDILLEIIGERIDIAGEHQILPDKDSVLIAGIIECITRVIAATPYADAVEVRGC